ncbi:MAG TPA: RNA pseudouridine synthase, partial [Xanthomonadales bacterium]|nr:RNA pseudouridine synthase [Xanthomonadales bacterium]
SLNKHYLCLMDGRLPEDLVEVDAPLGREEGDARAPVSVQEDGKPSRTRFRLLQRYQDCSYVEAELLSGRTHQIRAHARHLGLALAGDSKYADREARKRWKKRGLNRLFLHAHRLALEAPAGEHLELDAPLPDELRQVLDRLEM